MRPTPKEYSGEDEGVKSMRVDPTYSFDMHVTRVSENPVRTFVRRDQVSDARLK